MKVLRDAARMDKAGVPLSLQSYRTKPENALEEIDRVIAVGVRFGFFLTDAGYGLLVPFRQALTGRELRWLSVFRNSLCKHDDLKGSHGKRSGHGQPACAAR